MRPRLRPIQPGIQSATYVAPPSRRPPIGPAGDSGARTEFDFEFLAWVNTIKHTNWEDYGYSRTDTNGESGHFKTSTTTSSDKVPITVRAENVAQALEKVGISLGVRDSDKVDESYPKTRTVVELKYTTVSVKEVS